MKMKKELSLCTTFKEDGKFHVVVYHFLNKGNDWTTREFIKEEIISFDTVDKLRKWFKENKKYMKRDRILLTTVEGIEPSYEIWTDGEKYILIFDSMLEGRYVKYSSKGTYEQFLKEISKINNADLQQMIRVKVGKI